jgi:hypothetical protein
MDPRPSRSSLVAAGGRSSQGPHLRNKQPPRRGRLPVQSLPPEDAETGGGCVEEWRLLSWYFNCLYTVVTLLMHVLL